MNTIKTPVKRVLFYIDDADGLMLAQCAKIEQAAELARVINFHDALVEALSACVLAINPLLTELRNPDDEVFRGKFIAIQDKGRAALKLAEGQP